MLWKRYKSLQHIQSRKSIGAHIPNWVFHEVSEIWSALLNLSLKESQKTEKTKASE